MPSARHLLATALLLCAPALTGCTSDRRPVLVLTAGSLTRAFAELEQQLERQDPTLDVRLELGGSQQLCRKLVELGGRADVLAVADYRVIDRICRPAGKARFNIHFATNQVVLAHLSHSKDTDRITAQNWPSVLQQPGVRLALVDPNLGPIGYRTLLVWQLTEQQLGAQAVGGPGLARRLRARVAAEHLVPHENELLRLLQTRAVDYAFVYASTAEAHNLKVVRLPETVNLGQAARASSYARAQVEVELARGARRTVRGAPVVYGITIPVDAPNPMGARRFVQALLGPVGHRLLDQAGFHPLRPAPCSERSLLPAALQGLTR